MIIVVACVQLRQNVHFSNCFTVEAKHAVWSVTPRQDMTHDCSCCSMSPEAKVSIKWCRVISLQVFTCIVHEDHNFREGGCTVEASQLWTLSLDFFVYHFPLELFDVCSQLCSRSGIWLDSPMLWVWREKTWQSVASSQMTAMKWATHSCTWLRTQWRSWVRTRWMRTKKWLLDGW